MSTSFTIQCFRLKGRTLVADAPKSARSADAAIELAERLAVSKSGVVAFSQEIDIETDSYDEPRVLLYRTDTSRAICRTIASRATSALGQKQHPSRVC